MPAAHHAVVTRDSFAVKPYWDLPFDPRHDLSEARMIEDLLGILDEATRLSRDNIGVLFELCQSLDLQLLIAAPEVAQARDNTTYRLVRTLDEAGREVVVASGRRLTTEA